MCIRDRCVCVLTLCSVCNVISYFLESAGNCVVVNIGECYEVDVVFFFICCLGVCMSVFCHLHQLQLSNKQKQAEVKVQLVFHTPNSELHIINIQKHHKQQNHRIYLEQHPLLKRISTNNICC